MNWYAYPPSIKVWTKAMPAFATFLTFGFFHALIIYNIVYHTGERIEKYTWKSSKFERAVRKQDDIMRIYYKRAATMQPNDPTELIAIRPMFRT